MIPSFRAPTRQRAPRRAVAATVVATLAMVLGLFAAVTPLGHGRSGRRRLGGNRTRPGDDRLRRVPRRGRDDLQQRQPGRAGGVDVHDHRYDRERDRSDPGPVDLAGPARVVPGHGEARDDRQRRRGRHAARHPAHQLLRDPVQRLPLRRRRGVHRRTGEPGRRLRVPPHGQQQRLQQPLPGHLHPEQQALPRRHHRPGQPAVDRRRRPAPRRRRWTPRGARGGPLVPVPRRARPDRSASTCPACPPTTTWPCTATSAPPSSG